MRGFEFFIDREDNKGEDNKGEDNGLDPNLTIDDTGDDGGPAGCMFKGAFGFGLLLFGMFALYGLINGLDVELRYAPVTATITDVGAPTPAGKHGWRPNITYTYLIKGQQYGSARVLAGSSGMSEAGARDLAARYKAGDRVRAYADPSDPRQAVLVRRLPPMDFALAACIVPGMLMFVVYMWRQVGGGLMWSRFEATYVRREAGRAVVRCCLPSGSRGTLRLWLFAAPLAPSCVGMPLIYGLDMLLPPALVIVFWLADALLVQAVSEVFKAIDFDKRYVLIIDRQAGVLTLPPGDDGSAPPPISLDSIDYVHCVDAQMRDTIEGNKSKVSSRFVLLGVRGRELEVRAGSWGENYWAAAAMTRWFHKELDVPICRPPAGPDEAPDAAPD